MNICTSTAAVNQKPLTKEKLLECLELMEKIEVERKLEEMRERIIINPFYKENTFRGIPYYSTYNC